MVGWVSFDFDLPSFGTSDFFAVVSVESFGRAAALSLLPGTWTGSRDAVELVSGPAGLSAIRPASSKCELSVTGDGAPRRRPSSKLTTSKTRRPTATPATTGYESVNLM